MIFDQNDFRLMVHVEPGDFLPIVFAAGLETESSALVEAGEAEWRKTKEVISGLIFKCRMALKFRDSYMVP